MDTNTACEIYGITGARHAGKDTFAKFVNETATPPFAVRWFAGPLKQMVQAIWPWLTAEDLNDPVKKECAFAAPIVMDLAVAKMRAVTRIDIQPRGLLADSPRRLLQFFGTDYVRAVQDDYWIRQFEKSIAGEARVLVPDTRFFNEADFLRSIAARIVRVQRPASERLHDARQTHASELLWEQIPADIIVNNPTGDFGPLRSVAQLVAAGRFLDAVRASCTNWQPDDHHRPELVTSEGENTEDP